MEYEISKKKNLIAKYKLTRTDNLFFSQALNIQDVNDFSFLLAIQIIRTREFREYIKQMYTKSIKYLTNFKYKMENPDKEFEDIKAISNKIEIKFDENAESAYHASFLSDKKYLEDLMEILKNNIWFIGVNQTDIQFLTSDHPVVKNPHTKTLDGYTIDGNPIKSFKDIGYALTGVQIIYPISDELIFLLHEPTYFKRIKKYKNNLYMS